MDILMSLLPLAIVIVGFIGLELGGRVVAPVSLILTVLIAGLYFKSDWTAIVSKGWAGIVSGAKLMYMLWAALIIVKILIGTGAIVKLREIAAIVTDDKRKMVVLISWGFGSFIEGVSAAGSPGVICIPLGGIGMINRQLIDQMRKDNPFIPLNDVIYEIIKEEIVLFHLYPNSRVRESVIAENLGISRSPVKDALEHLEAESYVVKIPGSGYRVASFSRAEYTGIMDLAFLLEPYAAGQAAKIMTDNQLDFLYSTAKEMHDLYKEEEKENTKQNNQTTTSNFPCNFNFAVSNMNRFNQGIDHS